MKKFFCFFAALLFAGSMMATEVTITASDFTETTSADYSTTKGGVTVAVTASTVTADQMRIFKSQSITISAASNITSIVFTCTANGTAKYGPGCFAAQTGYTYEASGNTGTWVGSATSVSFTAESNQVRATQIVVTIEGGASDDSTVVPVDTTPVIVPVTMENLTFNANIWNVADVNEKYAAWVWGDNLEGMWTDFFTPLNAENMYGAQIPETADSIVFVRLDNAIDTVTWNNIWNQTVDYAINHADMYFTIEGWGEGENAKSYGTWGTPVVYNTCADVNAVTANTNMTLNEVTVVFAKGAYIYVKDETATTLVYTNNYSTLQAGDRVSGIAGEAKLYRNLPELAPTTAIEDLTIVPGEAPVIFDAQAAPTTANINQVMMFRGVQMPTASFTTTSATNITGIFAGEEVAFRNNWKEAYDFDSTKTYTMLGCVAIFNTTLQVYVTNIEEEVAPVQHYYIKNNWDGAEAWTWQEMNPVMNNVIYEYTGVFGGLGVNINTVAEDNGSTWFPVADFRTIDSTYVPQALDTIHFVYSIVDSVIAVELVGRPAVDTIQHYYIKNNWNGGNDWAWVEMNTVIDNVLYDYTGVFGGSGVNINTAAEDNANAIWFPVADFRKIDSTYVPQALDTIHFVYSIVDSVIAVELVGRPAPAPLTYYIKNNWNGGSAWTWEEMSPVVDNVLYEYTGVFGGTGVNINTTTADEDATWFPVADFSLIDSTYVPQALDTIHFVYSIVDATLAVELVGRPAGDSVLHYYIKNNWEAGSEWTWVEMNMVIDSSVYEYTGVFGGTGVNINTMATDAGAIWFPVEDFSLIDPTYVPQALDTIHFVYSIVDSALAVELVGRPVIEEIQYYIKNNWNGGEWTWEEMTPANDGNITWTYRGIFGGTGVNINNLPIDADAIWFPVDEWLFTTLGYEPEAGDDILFEFNSELLTLTATFMGRDGLETVTFQREGETMKLIHNGQLYIIRDGKMYNALGAQVR